MNPILTTVYLALAVAAISLTISKGAIFKPIRKFVLDCNDWLGKLVRCPWCLAHWLAFGGVAIYRPRLVHSSVALVDYFVSTMTCVGIATMFIGLIWTALVQLIKEH